MVLTRSSYNKEDRAHEHFFIIDNSGSMNKYKTFECVEQQISYLRKTQPQCIINVTSINHDIKKIITRQSCNDVYKISVKDKRNHGISCFYDNIMEYLNDITSMSDDSKTSHIHIYSDMDDNGSIMYNKSEVTNFLKCLPLNWEHKFNILR